MPTQTIQWPYLRLTLPPDADPEMTGLLTQAAADNGALGAMTEGFSLLLYLPKDADEAAVQAVIDAVYAEAEGIGWSGLALDRDSLADQPWATAWKVDFKDIPVGQSLLIRPDWEMGQPKPAEFADRKTIWLRPGSGFGTGRHETTRLALELLESNIDEAMRILDFGSGSGILSIAAIKLGAASVTAVEMDPEANQNAKENFELNGVTPRIYLREGNTPEVELGQYNLIVANMLPHEVLPHLEVLAQHLNNDQEGVFVYSGFLLEQQNEIEAAFARVGLVAQSFAQQGEWGAMAGTLMHHVSLEY